MSIEKVDSKTGSVNDVLMQGENILVECRPAKIPYIINTIKSKLILFLFSGLFMCISGYFTFFNRDSDAIQSFSGVVFMFLFASALFVLAFVSVIKEIIAHKNIVYVVTDKRILSRNGLVGLDFASINYTDISNVKVDVSVIENFFKVGSVVLTVSDGFSINLHCVPDPYSVYKKVNKVFMDMNADIQFPNANRPEDNPGYNTKYNGFDN